MNKRDKIREMKNVLEKMEKLKAIRKSVYDGMIEELGLIDDDITFDFFFNGPYSRKQAENVLSVEFRMRERSRLFPILRTRASDRKPLVQVERHQDKKKIKVECAACYDEEGSEACIRPAHSAYDASGHRGLIST